MEGAKEDVDVAVSLAAAKARIAFTLAKLAPGEREPRLVAVSKTKPNDMILQAYAAGHRCFGENYVQELVDKAASLPKDISWHFIGHLQSNKAKTLLEGVPNLAMIETVDSAKLADKLNEACRQIGRSVLPVMIQVNTSGEESKYGVPPGEAVALAQHVSSQCPGLKLVGLMTIGMPDYSSRPEDFRCLSDCRRQVGSALGLLEQDLELSMGMSNDFEQAIEMGSTNVRLGSTIFGARVKMVQG
eukprot:jgi/Mesvir1/29138/Mv18435-RA.1